MPARGLLLWIRPLSQGGEWIPDEAIRTFESTGIWPRTGSGGSIS